MSFQDIEKKLEQYENTAVEVANQMHNPNVRAENSKEIINNFPNVRLASEKNKKVEGRGRKFLPSILISAIIGAGCFGLGYHTRTVRQNTERVSNSIEELINRDLARNQGFTFSGDLDFFAEMYGLRLFALKPQPYIKDSIKQHFQKYIDPQNPTTIIYKCKTK